MQYVTRRDLREELFPAADRGGYDVRASVIARIEDLLTELRGDPQPSNVDLSESCDLQSYSKKLYSSRRMIDKIFGMDGFGSSPAWDVMLDLFHNEENGKTVSITSACIGAACPSTTALRWIQALCNMSLIERHDDPKDKRRSYVTLTAKGRDATISALKAHFSQ